MQIRHTIQPENKRKIFRILQDNLPMLVRLEEATFEEDTKQATDLVIKLKARAIAVRVRNTTAQQYGDPDVTIRSYAKGHRTELDKIRSGWGDIYLYCWQNLMEYVLYDLNKLRQTDYLKSNLAEIDNRDGTKFITIPIRFLKDNDCILASNLEDFIATPKEGKI